jgi:hypothetical protein
VNHEPTIDEQYTDAYIAVFQRLKDAGVPDKDAAAAAQTAAYLAVGIIKPQD